MWMIGNAPRLGQFGFQKNDDAVEGVILMRRGEQTQNVLAGVEKKTEELNHGILPPDVKVHPFYDRSDLVRAHDRHRRAQSAARHVARADRAHLFPGQRPRGRHRRADRFRSACCSRSSSARARRTRQPAVDRRHRFRHHHRRHRRDDGEHLPRARAIATANPTSCAT